MHLQNRIHYYPSTLLPSSFRIIRSRFRSVCSHPAYPHCMRSSISLFCRTTFTLSFLALALYKCSGQTLDRLVAVSSVHYCTSTSALSTSSSSRGLTACDGISHLEGLHARCAGVYPFPDMLPARTLAEQTGTPVVSPTRSRY